MDGVRADGLCPRPPTRRCRPSSDALIRDSTGYLAVTSLIGAAALVGGLLVLISRSRPGFAPMIVSMVVLRLVSTVHHRTRISRLIGVSAEDASRSTRADARVVTMTRCRQPLA